jgi:hypothetical protein
MLKPTGTSHRLVRSRSRRAAQLKFGKSAPQAQRREARDAKERRLRVV